MTDERTPSAVDVPRTLRPVELSAAHELSALCFGHSTLQDLPPGSYRPTQRQTVEVISRGRKPVCQMGLYHSRMSVCGSRFRVASVGGVCTHPAYRGQGLATRLLRHSFDKLRALGSRLVLISGTRGLYRRAGCVGAQMVESVVLHPGELSAGATDVSVRPACVEDAPLCARLQQLEPVHFVRPVEVYRREIARHDPGPGDNNWIVRADGREVGYVFLRTPWGHGPQDRMREMAVQGEWSGCRAAFVDALPLLIERLDLVELWLVVPWQDLDLNLLLHSRGMRGEASTMAWHTMRLLDFPGLMGDLQHYVTDRLTRDLRRGLEFGQSGDCYSITRGPERLELDGAAMTRLVFGAPAHLEHPLPAPGGALGEILAGIFPLPSFIPGLNCR